MQNPYLWLCLGSIIKHRALSSWLSSQSEWLLCFSKSAKSPSTFFRLWVKFFYRLAARAPKVWIVIITTHKVQKKRIEWSFEKSISVDKFKCLEAKCREKTLEKSDLEPTAPNRLVDRKHCALSTQPNPHLRIKFCLEVVHGYEEAIFMINAHCPSFHDWNEGCSHGAHIYIIQNPMEAILACHLVLEYGDCAGWQFRVK